MQQISSHESEASCDQPNLAATVVRGPYCRERVRVPSRQGTKKGHLFDLRNPFDKACERAGVENFRIQDLRHTFASMAVRGGAILYDVQKFLGHQNIEMTSATHTSRTKVSRGATAGVATMLDKAAA